MNGAPYEASAILACVRTKRIQRECSKAAALQANSVFHRTRLPHTIETDGDRLTDLPQIYEYTARGTRITEFASSRFSKTPSSFLEKIADGRIAIAHRSQVTGWSMVGGLVG
jgi:hypothetical protein